jgi:hypothetical protein
MSNRSRTRLYLRVTVAVLLAGMVVGLVPGTPAKAAAAMPTTSVLVPSAGATLSGTTATLDAGASNATSVEFWIAGGSYGFSGKMIGAAKETIYGWAYSWNTTTVSNGSYDLLSEATGAGGSAFSAGVPIKVSNNPLPTTSVLVPTSGATLSGTTTLDASASNATSVEFRLFGGIYGYSAAVLCTGTPTYYGWLCSWDTTTVPSGSYVLVSEASNSVGSAFSSGVSITVTIPSSSVAFVQADDTGTFNGNTTSISSGQSNRVLAHNTGIGHSVVLMIQTLTDPGTETDTVTSVSSGMGTFHFVNSYNDGADTEIWVCPDTTGAADTVTVTTPTNAWDAFAVEFNAPATGWVNGGGQVVADLPYLSDQSWTVSPGAAGNIAFIGVDTLGAYDAAPTAPWTSYNSGYWSFSNGTSAAWQVAPSSSPLTATWVTDGGESSSQGVVLEY